MQMSASLSSGIPTASTCCPPLLEVLAARRDVEKGMFLILGCL